MERNDPPRLRWIRIALFFYGPVAIVSAGWIAWRGGWDILRDRLLGTGSLEDVALGGAAGLAVVIASRILTHLWGPGRRMEAAFVRLIGPIGSGACLVLAVASGLGEELFFRAALQPEIGIWAASLLFGVLHFPFEKDLAGWLPFAIGMGFLLGWEYETTGSIMAPAVTHFLTNYLNLLRIAARAAKTSSLPADPRAAQPD